MCPRSASAAVTVGDPLERHDGKPIPASQAVDGQSHLLLQARPATPIRAGRQWNTAPGRKRSGLSEPGTHPDFAMHTMGPRHPSDLDPLRARHQPSLARLVTTCGPLSLHWAA